MGLFKKPKPQTQESESGNHAWEGLNTSLSPATGYVTQGGDMLANLLGVGSGGTAAQTGALDNFANSGGMGWLMDQGNRMINSNQSAKGLLAFRKIKGIEKAIVETAKAVCYRAVLQKVPLFQYHAYRMSTYGISHIIITVTSSGMTTLPIDTMLL